jgi:hypothetical protein
MLSLSKQLDHNSAGIAMRGRQTSGVVLRTFASAADILRSISKLRRDVENN